MGKGHSCIRTPDNKSVNYETKSKFKTSNKSINKKHYKVVNNNYNNHNNHNNTQPTQKFTAEGENCVAETVIMYQPGIEVFLSCLHPKGSLYSKTTTRNMVSESYNNFVNELQKNNVDAKNVRDILKMEKEKLKELANKSLKYIHVDTNTNNNTNDDEKYTEFIEFQNKYKKTVLEELDDDSLIDIILTQPIVEYSLCSINTGINIEYVKCKPIGNLVFCRDQQITTNNGVIIGRLHSTQREFEINIMKLVFDNLNIKYYQLPKYYKNNKCYLEGGDFIPINKNLSCLGVGLRTNIYAAEYLMDNDLIGSDRLAIIFDKNDKDQDRMHLDTIFNILNDKNVVVLDFDTVPNDHKKDINRTVTVYERNIYNKYKIISENIDFYEFLKNEGFNIIRVTHKQQLEYIINFLNIGNGNIISVNKQLKEIVDKNKIGDENINIKYVEFNGIKAMYGAAHCSTQVSRIPKYQSQYERPRYPNMGFIQQFNISK